MSGEAAVAVNNGSPPAAPPASPPAGAPPAAPPAAPAAWTDSIADVELRDWSVNKGYNKYDPAGAAPVIAQQYRNLEKLIGAEKAGRTVEVPDFEKGDEASINSYFERIGRPKDSKDYDLSLPKPEDGLEVNPALEKFARDNFHKAGLNIRQAKIMGEAWNEFARELNAQSEAAAAARYEKEDKGLKTEWGAAYENKMSIAAAVAKRYGAPPEMLVNMQKAGGYDVAIRWFANLAAGLGEDQFVSGDRAPNGAVPTPVEAKAKLAQLQNDKEWMAAWLDKRNPRHKDVMAEKAKLTSFMVGIAPTA